MSSPILNDVKQKPPRRKCGEWSNQAALVGVCIPNGKEVAQLARKCLIFRPSKRRADNIYCQATCLEFPPNAQMESRKPLGLPDSSDKSFFMHV